MEKDAHFKSVGRVLWIVLVANLAVAGVKVALGLFTGALAVVADGFHSLVDSSSNLIGLAAIRLARRPADERYPYGYQRYETIGALAIGVMLLAAAWEIGKAVIDRIPGGEGPQISLWTLALVALTFPVNLAIVVLETRAGRRMNSEILLADAAHTRTDLYVTLSVIASLVGVWLGWAWLDLVVASAVVLLILRAALRILSDTAASLSDVVAADAERVAQVAERVPGVLYVHHVRSRGTRGAGFVDLHVKVHPGMSTSQAHAIASEVERRLKESIPGVVDALVHIEPGRHDGASDWERIAFDLRQIADSMAVGLHDLHVRAAADGDYTIELHLELPGDLSLGDAHDLAEDFESRVKARWPRAGSVITHLEPIAEAVLPQEGGVGSQLEGQIRSALLAHLKEADLLELRTHLVGDHINLAVRFSQPAGQPLTQAHRLAEAVERDLLARFPQLVRVVVHVEPR
jgi:cation diffusion facilitator family transporter